MSTDTRLEEIDVSDRGGSDLGMLDKQAFSGQVERHRRELHVHCYRMLGSFQDAEDTVQETFLRAWRRRETFEGRSTFRAWLYRIATNASLDLLAKRRPERLLTRRALQGHPARAQVEVRRRGSGVAQVGPLTADSPRIEPVAGRAGLLEEMFAAKGARVVSTPVDSEMAGVLGAVAVALERIGDNDVKGERQAMRSG